MYLSNPSTICDTKLIFKRCLTGLNSEFSFSNVSCHTKVAIPFPRELALLKCKQPCLEFELGSMYPFSLTIKIHHQCLQKKKIYSISQMHFLARHYYKTESDIHSQRLQILPTLSNKFCFFVFSHHLMNRNHLFFHYKKRCKILSDTQKNIHLTPC